jgi:dGTPase
MRATIRRMMNIFVMDLCHESQVRIDKKNMNTIDDVRNEEAIIALSEDLTKKQQSLKQFLRKALYLHPRVKVMTDNAHEVISLLFKKLMQNPSLINIDEHHNQHDLAKFVSDYIAGMTDRFALQTFEKLC